MKNEQMKIAFTSKHYTILRDLQNTIEDGDIKGNKLVVEIPSQEACDDMAELINSRWCYYDLVRKDGTSLRAYNRFCKLIFKTSRQNLLVS